MNTDNSADETAQKLDSKADDKDFYFHIKSVQPGALDKPDADSLVVFVHYDGGGRVARYVEYYLECLAKVPNFNVIFVSNAPNISDQELEKVKPFVQKVITRENIGYDMAAFYTGFNYQNAIDGYKRLLFVNDSVYGPFGGLEPILPQILSDDYDFLAPTDSIVPQYHLQPYLGACNLTPGMCEVLDFYSNNFRIIDDKKEVVQFYELGWSSRSIEKGLRLKALYPYEDVLQMEESITDDPVLNKLRATKHPYLQPSVTQWIRSFFSRKLRAKLLREKTVGDPTLRNWYVLLKYMKSPFLKTRNLKVSKFFSFHQMTYKKAIEEAFPDYDVSMITDHLKRVRRF